MCTLLTIVMIDLNEVSVLITISFYLRISDAKLKDYQNSNVWDS